jgi:DNA polymerase-3 subunit alpha
MIHITYSHYSLQEAFSHIDEIVDRACKFKLPYVILADYNSVAGCPEFIQLVLKNNKKNKDNIIKPIIGFTSFYNNKKIHILSLKRDGWFSLVKIISRLNSKDHFLKYKNSHIQDEDLSIIKSDNNLYLLYSDDNISESYYVDKDDLPFQQILICNKLKTDIDNKDSVLKNYPEYQIFFNNNDFSLKEYSSEQWVDFDKFEIYDISSPSRLPVFKNEKNEEVDPDKYLTDLCRIGWSERKMNDRFIKYPELKTIYVERVKEELDTLKKYNISNYMLLVRDFTNFTKSNNACVGLRGSAVGSLVFYLTGVTNIDPVWPDTNIPYDSDKSLLFSRFINKGRLAEGKNALPDVDIDIPISFRDKLKDYIYKKYGHDKAAHIAAFGKIKAKMAIKDVFRIRGKSFDVANEITSKMIDESKVQDELEDLKQVDSKYNIINYNIEYIEDLSNYYKEYKNEFDIAIRLNNTNRSFSQHAAGLVLADIPLKDFLPIYYDSEKDLDVVGLKMQDVEYCGAVKYDLLSLAAYSKIDEIIKMVNKNTNEPEMTTYELEENYDI